MTAVITQEELKSSQHWFRKIDVGTRMFLQFLDQRQTRTRAELLGFRVGHYIIVRYEEQETLPTYLSGYVAVVRFLVEDLVGECLAFKANVIHCTRSPDKIIYFAFPDEIYHRPLRNQQRAATKIPASLRVNTSVDSNTKSYEGYIADISEGGCRFIFSEDDSKNKQVKKLPVVINIGNGQRIIPGEVRSARTEGTLLSVGIKFNETQNDLERGPSGFISELIKT
ncbi:MAG: PilZ domain [Idiomarinaceae bacterium HL-53]|nr:MAG: PilZ domain [Idiomarinaceae bacterium HL-53]CUS47600.1 PilZ domain-containing protein [Idiomarinaceae bacterium HL-53]